MKLVKDMPFFDALNPHVGDKVTVYDGAERFTGLLTIWDAPNGNQGWMVSKTGAGIDGDEPYLLFSPNIVSSVRQEVTLFDREITVSLGR